jgi:hypothetical protein
MFSTVQAGEPHMVLLHLPLGPIFILQLLPCLHILLLALSSSCLLLTRLQGSTGLCCCSISTL